MPESIVEHTGSDDGGMSAPADDVPLCRRSARWVAAFSVNGLKVYYEIS
jgi:hypothetical protein